MKRSLLPTGGLLTMLSIWMIVLCGHAILREAAAQADSCPRGKIETKVTFKNHRAGAVTYHWLNEQCKEVPYGDIRHDKEATVNTYSTEVWRVRDKASQKLLLDISADALPRRVHVTDARRTTMERDDDASGYLVKVLYVLPSDGVDRALDTNGAIVLSVAAMQQWFLQQTGGKRFRFHTYKGDLDIGFVRLRSLEADLKRENEGIRDKIEEELRSAGWTSPRKLYLVYYDGDATECGGALTKSRPGSVAAIYLQGRRGEPDHCEKELAKSVDHLTPHEYGALHEIVHTLGFVAACAPNVTKRHTCPDRRVVTDAHVKDNPRDLMYAGCDTWAPAELDVGRDDYFKHRNPGCLDLDNSAFLDPRGKPPPNW